MSAPHDPRHAASPTPGAPSTQEIPIVQPDAPEPTAAPGGPPPGSPTGGTRAGSLPAPGQQPPQHAVPHPVPPPPATAQPLPPAWPDTLADDPAPPTRPATTSDGGTDERPSGPGASGPGASGSAASGSEASGQGAVGGVQPTGPVDFVPGLPGAGTTHPEPRRRPRLPSASLDRTALAAVGLAALAVVLLQLGLTRDDADLWSVVSLWAVFATAATVLGLVVLAARLVAPARVPERTATRLVGAAVLALAIFWLLVVLPIVASDPGFLVTAALLALGAALWVGPRGER